MGVSDREKRMEEHGTVRWTSSTYRSPTLPTTNPWSTGPGQRECEEVTLALVPAVALSTGIDWPWAVVIKCATLIMPSHPHTYLAEPPSVPYRSRLKALIPVGDSTNGRWHMLRFCTQEVGLNTSPSQCRSVLLQGLHLEFRMMVMETKSVLPVRH